MELQLRYLPMAAGISESTRLEKPYHSRATTAFIFQTRSRTSIHRPEIRLAEPASLRVLHAGDLYTHPRPLPRRPRAREAAAVFFFVHIFGILRRHRARSRPLCTARYPPTGVRRRLQPRGPRAGATRPLFTVGALLVGPASSRASSTRSPLYGGFLFVYNSTQVLEDRPLLATVARHRVSRRGRGEILDLSCPSANTDSRDAFWRIGAAHDRARREPSRRARR